MPRALVFGAGQTLRATPPRNCCACASRWRQLAEVERLDLVREVRELIGELLVDGGAATEQVAARLGMPARRLRERLAMAGVRFNDLVTDYRCRPAKELLLRSTSIEVIVERTGFSEPSTFLARSAWVGEDAGVPPARGSRGAGRACPKGLPVVSRCRGR